MIKKKAHKKIEPLVWKKEDFVFEKIKMTEWESYLLKFPNLAWGTCIVEKNDEDITVKRFIDKATCIKYCTAPTCSDFGIGI